LLHLLQQLAQRLFAELGESRLGAKRLQARFELAGGQVWNKASWASEGLGPLMLPGLLDALLRELQQAGKDSEGVTAIELQLTCLEPAGGRQLQLFTQMEDRYRLHTALGKLARKHASGSVVQAEPRLASDEVIAARYEFKAV